MIDRTRLAVAVALAVALAATPGCSDSSRTDALKRDGDALVARIEQFRRDSARLPASLAALGIDEKESGPLHYERRGDSSYVVWFGTTLGESVTWSSEARAWSDAARP